MKIECSELRVALGIQQLESSHREHLEGCEACRELEAGYLRLDAILNSEPVPTAPADFLAQVMERVLVGVRSELLWMRSRTLVAAVAAVLLLVFASNLDPTLFFVAEDSTPMAAEFEFSLAALDRGEALLEATQLQLDAGLQQALSAGPGLPWLLLCCLLPFLLGINWWIARRGISHGVGLG